VEWSRILERDLADTARAPVFGGRAARRQLRHETREFHQVLARLARRVAAKAREAVGDVGRIADLVGLAVAHDVDAGRNLPAYNLGDRVGDDRCGGHAVADLAFLPRESARRSPPASAAGCRRAW
jgi:hypothetical protein